jgi:hypothetical protein
MRRLFFGLVALAAGVGALHFLSRWLQIRDSSACMTDPRCQQRVQRGGEQGSDRQKAIALFALAGISIWVSASRSHG